MEDRQLVVIGLVVIGIVLLWYIANKPNQTTEYDARNFVINDATSKYPEAEITVTSSNYTNNSWKMKVKATLNPNSQCPERIHLYYDYPAMQFATRPPEHITKNCQICMNVPKCIIVFPEEALIASHTFPGTERVQMSLDDFPNAIGEANFEESYMDYYDVWVVSWTYTEDGDSETPALFWGMTVTLDKNGNVLSLEEAIS
ncbi:MAG: hypothetical protein ABIG39_02505 [Candidatus Micrarchaeota archaeon]